MVSVLCAAALAGCSSAFKLDEPVVPVETRSIVPVGSQAGGAGAESTSVPAQTQRGSADMDANSTDVGKVGRIVYFDFDSYAVKDDYRKLIEAHARRLSADRNLRLSVEGHTDERGGSEYNLALGQRRAEAVAKSLILLGASEAQVEPVSFGKERPAMRGGDEAAWAQNRRAELKDK